MKYLVHKKRTISSGVSMSSLSDHVEFDNANGEKEHSAKPPKLKRQKLSASSSGLRAGHDGGQPIRVLRSRKRVQEVGTPTSTHHHPCTVLSWLIDNNVVQPTEKVHYCCTKGSHPLAQGKVSRKGIVCNCCEEVFSLGSFQSHAGCSETHAGCSNHRPAANIFIEDGKSLLDCQMQIMTKRMKRICGPEPRDMMKDNCPRDKNDTICTVCQDGGDLILCDLCPSAFHKSCMGLKVAYFVF